MKCVVIYVYSIMRLYINLISNYHLIALFFLLNSSQIILALSGSFILFLYKFELLAAYFRIGDWKCFYIVSAASYLR
jgi:hypothetical protein